MQLAQSTSWSRPEAWGSDKLLYCLVFFVVVVSVVIVFCLFGWFGVVVLFLVV